MGPGCDAASTLSTQESVEDQCCANQTEPQTDYISRSSILPYNIELTDKATRLNQVTKQNNIATKKQAMKRQSRKRYSEFELEVNLPLRIVVIAFLFSLRVLGLCSYFGAIGEHARAHAHMSILTRCHKSDVHSCVHIAFAKTTAYQRAYPRSMYIDGRITGAAGLWCLRHHADFRTCMDFSAYICMHVLYARAPVQSCPART
eukprot:6203532-Pleurochrysis_carterae.AAC.2